MRKIIYLTQDEIDKFVQNDLKFTHRDYNNFRAFQDGLITEVTTAFEIYRRKVDQDIQMSQLLNKGESNG